MIGVIVHEVGHNFFPMIINNDERETTWMDEGVNSFVQYLTQVENYKDMPQRRGHAQGIVPYMKGDKTTMRPLMTS
ncbi:MAG: M1 family peptidase, partial [Cyclobacteriaceae bacterium]